VALYWPTPYDMENKQAAEELEKKKNYSEEAN